MFDQSPVRACCGQRHWTTQCPDGLTMCCLCFGRFPLDRLNVTDEGDREDVCTPCAENERQLARRREAGQ